MKKNNVRVAVSMAAAISAVAAMAGSAQAQPIPQPGASELATLAGQYRVDQLRGWATMSTCDQWSRVAETATNAAVANATTCTSDSTNAATALNGARRACGAENRALRDQLAAAEARCPAPPTAPNGERPLVRAVICRNDLGGATPVCRIRGRREDSRGEECVTHSRELVMSRCECGTAGGVTTRVAHTSRTYYCGTPFGGRTVPPPALTPAVAQGAASFEQRIVALEGGMGALCTADWSASVFVQRQLATNTEANTEGGEPVSRPLTPDQFRALPTHERCAFVAQALFAALQQLSAGNTAGAGQTLTDAETRFRTLETRVTAVEANVSRRPIFRPYAQAFFLFRGDGTPASGGVGGVAVEFPLGQTFALEANVDVGAGYYGYAPTANDSATRFTWGAGFGGRIRLSDRTALSLGGTMRSFVDSGLQSAANASYGEYLGWFFAGRVAVDIVFNTIHGLTLGADLGVSQDARDTVTTRPDGSRARSTENVSQFAGGAFLRYGLRF